MAPRRPSTTMTTTTPRTWRPVGTRVCALATGIVVIITTITATDAASVPASERQLRHAVGFSALRGGLHDEPKLRPARGLDRDPAAGSGSLQDPDAGSAGGGNGSELYKRPGKGAFYDVVGGLNKKWTQIELGEPVPTQGVATLTAYCDDGGDLSPCLRECARRCFARNTCHWFTLDTTTKDCALLTGVRMRPKGDFKAAADGPSFLAGYVKAVNPAFLHARANCTATFRANEDSFCVTEDGRAFYFEPEAATAPGEQCAGHSPLTFFRAFQNNFYSRGKSTSMAQELEDGRFRNAAAMAPTAVGGNLTLDAFLKLLGPKSSGWALTTAQLDEDLQETGTSTTWRYRLDPRGRVRAVSATLGPADLLVAKGDPNQPPRRRQDYCPVVLDRRFTHDIHALEAVAALDPQQDFGAGHIADCRLTSPNGFWNLVPLPPASATKGGCWARAGDLVAKLLEWGFRGKWSAELTYFDSIANLATEARGALARSHGLLTDEDLTAHYRTKGSGEGNGFKADFPCAYFYRPLSMKLQFELTGCESEDGANSYCALAWPGLEAGGRVLFSVQNGTIETTRALAHWAFEGPREGTKPAEFAFLKALATASEGLCFAETGRSLSSFRLLPDFAQAYLVTDDGLCVDLGDGGDGDGKAPKVAACAKDSKRYSFHPQSSKCLEGTKGAACPTFRYARAKLNDTTTGKPLALTSPDELVTGTLAWGERGCLVVQGKNASIAPSSDDGSKKKKETNGDKPGACTQIRATYVLPGDKGPSPGAPLETAGSSETDGSAKKGADGDNDDAAAAGPRRRDPSDRIVIDDPDPETTTI